MRKIPKPSPPKANVRPDGQKPARLEEAERLFCAELKARFPGDGHDAERSEDARTAYGALDTEQLRNVMRTAQGQLCVYCERQIPEGTSTRIDHWRPLSKQPELALHWKNLYLSCATEDTCDKAKGDKRLCWPPDGPELPWPCDCAYEKRIGFSLNGELYVRADAPLDESMRQSLACALHGLTVGDRTESAILCLNAPALVAARKAAVDKQKTRLNQQFPDRHASKEDRAALADKLLSTDSLPAFVSIRVAYLRGTLGKGK